MRYTKLLATLTVALLLFSNSSIHAQTDRVKTYSGTESGTVKSMTPMAVMLEKSGREQQIAVGDIRGIQFGVEPSELTQARANALSGAYAKALELLNKIDIRNGTDANVKQDVDYYRAYCNTKLALLGEVDLAEAGKQLNTFVRVNGDSYHRIEAEQLLGDLLAALGKYSAAQSQYQKLANTPWPSYKIRSAVLVGKSLQAQGKHNEAIAKFDQALAAEDDSPQSASQQQAARLAKAISLSASGNVDQGAALVRSVVAEADPKETELHAEAYNALGNCYLKAGRTKDALFAYLHVDLLYPTQPKAHAEALYYLANLWDEVGDGNEARQARDKLKSQYPTTSWAKK